MADQKVDKSWMWHPDFSEENKDTAGLFVHFRRTVHIAPDATVPCSLKIHITADTRYKLYVNGRLVTFGPVKGDPALWFYDEVDIGPYLSHGENRILVVVLRFFHGTKYATSFPRLPVGGLRIAVPDGTDPWGDALSSSTSWETAIDTATVLRIDEPEDDFLHVYERTTRRSEYEWKWVAASLHTFMTSTGNAPPWNLSPRLIPPFERQAVGFQLMHNLKSNVDESSWMAQLLQNESCDTGLVLPAGSVHQFDLEMEHHGTGLIQFYFDRSGAQGSTIKVTYSESYEDEPKLVPYLRIKGDRRDTTKALYGPSDTYNFQGETGNEVAWNQENPGEEVYSPFHFRTFRFLRVNITVGSSDLVFRRLRVETTTYPLNVRADLQASEPDDTLWSTSIRTLKNCMHDCYEDCPFYEQLQYAMDTRSSILFTYRTSGDDRLARQAIIQLHASFDPLTGLTASRAPSHNRQVIPHFSLYWVAMLADHWEHAGDATFLARFAPVVDAVLGYFHARIGDLGLVVGEHRPGIWNFTDWANEWRPYGIPPLAQRTGVSTYTNCLYAYTLRLAAGVLSAALDRPGIAQEYLLRADRIVQAVRKHCFDGEFFADGPAKEADKSKDYSQLNQAWAVLSGAISGPEAQVLMSKTLDPAPTGPVLIPTSLSTSFYVLRALSLAGGTVYEDHFHAFWAPWRAQLALNVTTWEEDSVSQRSDCHAWGCAPLYEFTAEVAGITPAASGWSVVRFRPCIALYRDFEARCPLGTTAGGADVIGIARVAWTTLASGDVHIKLSFEMATPRVLPVLIEVPGVEKRMVDTVGNVEFVVRRQGGSSSPWELIRQGDVGEPAQ